MADSAFVVEVDAGSFQQVVVDGSFERPVLVDFWAPWCGPCQSLMPMLAALAQEYDGGFLLAKVNTEQEQELAAQFGIRSIPTLKLYRHGEVVEELMGAQPEAVFRELIDRFRVRASDAQLAAAEQAFVDGDVKSAIEQANAIWLQEPDHHKAAWYLAQWLLSAGRFEEATAVAKRLPDEVEGQPVSTLLAQIDLAEASAGGESAEALVEALQANPEDHELRHKLGMRLVAVGRVEEGLEQLLTIVRKQATWNEGQARQSMLSVFEALGADDPRVGQYRRAMFNALY